MQIPSNAVLHNITEFVPHPEAKETMLNRIPETLRVRLNPSAQQRALQSTGCEIRFRLNSPTATIRLRACEVSAAQHGGGLAQILFGDFSHTYFPITTDTFTCELTAPDYESLKQATGKTSLFHPRLARVLLPTHATMCEIDIEGDIAPPEPGDTPARRVLNYGSSISQGSGSITSRECWAARCAHTLGVDLINLGFGGGCHCEPEMTDYLCQRDDFDFAILETGINMLGLDRDLTNERIENLIRKFSEAHRDKPTFCLGVFPCRNDIDNGYEDRAQEIRDLVRTVVRDIDSPNLHFIDGRDALDPATGLTTDLVHPSPAGMIEIGAHVAARVREIL